MPLHILLLRGASEGSLEVPQTPLSLLVDCRVRNRSGLVFLPRSRPKVQRGRRRRWRQQEWSDRSRRNEDAEKMEPVSKSSVFFGLQWEDQPLMNFRFRMNAVRMCEILTRRQLAFWEKEMFLFPRTCRLCRYAKVEGMIDCPDCKCVSYCSQQHYEEGIGYHKDKSKFMTTMS